MKSYLPLAAIALSCAVAACDSVASARTTSTTAAARTLSDSARADSIARARQDSINRAQPGYVVDSIFPVEEELRRFRVKVGGDAVSAFVHASASRDELVKRVVRDVARGDSTDLRNTLVTPREFADLIYPESPYTRAPYKQSPAILWTMIENPSTSGFIRLVRRRSESGLKLASYTCKDTAATQGRNRLWTDCVVRLVSAGGDTTAQKWFGTIVERDGRFKLMSFRNQF